MPFSHAVIFCFGYIFGSLISEYMKAQGFLSYAFFVNIPPGRFELNFAIIQAIVFCTTLLVGQRFLGGVSFQKSYAIQRYLDKLSNYRIFALVVAMIYGSIITVYYWDDMMAEHAVRHSGNHSLSRMTLLVVLFGALIFHGAGFVFRCIAFLVLIYMGTLSNSIGASRSVVIPFMLASLSFLQRKNYAVGVTLVYLGLVALSTAFAVRGNPSYFNFWNSYIFAVFDFNVLGYIRVAFQFSFPGLTSIQAAMYTPGDFSLDSIGRFVLYLSPIPSSMLSPSLFSGLSLSYALGIDRAILGINYDIFSEGIYWFGVEAAWIFTLSLGLLVLMPYYIASRIMKTSMHGTYLICLMANIWMVFGGQVFVLRAGSRAVMALSILLVAYSIARRLRFRRR